MWRRTNHSPFTVHISHADPRKKCESCGNVRFPERKLCSLLSNVKTFGRQKKKLTRLLQRLNCPMFAVRLSITTRPYRWPIGSLPSTCMLCTPPAMHQGRLHPAGINWWSVDSRCFTVIPTKRKNSRLETLQQACTTHDPRAICDPPVVFLWPVSKSCFKI
jgi:hypothetical protein